MSEDFVQPSSGNRIPPRSYRIRNVRTGIILPAASHGRGFLTFVSREKAEAWIVVQKPDLPFEAFEVVEADDGE